MTTQENDQHVRYQHKQKPYGKDRVETSDTPLLVAISIDHQETAKQLAYQLTRTHSSIVHITLDHQETIKNWLLVLCKKRTPDECINLITQFIQKEEKEKKHGKD